MSRHDPPTPARGPMAVAGAVVGRTVIFSVLWLSLWLLVPVVVLDWQPIAVAGNSMQPHLRPGDALLVSMPTPDAPAMVGSIVTFRRTFDGAVVTHRVVEINNDGSLVTKGDANQDTDSDVVLPEQVIGTGRLLVPMIGMAAVATPTMTWLMMAAILGAAVGMARKPKARPALAAPEAPVPEPVVAEPVLADPVLATTASTDVPVETGPAAAPLGDLWTAHDRRRRRWPRGATVATVMALMAGHLMVTPAPAARATFAVTTSASGSQLQNGTIETPTALTATFTSVLCALPSMSLTWVKSVDPDATSQQIYRTVNGGARTLLATKTAAATSHTDAAVTCGKTYVYEVITIAAFGATTWQSASVDGQNRRTKVT